MPLSISKRPVQTANDKTLPAVPITVQQEKTNTLGATTNSDSAVQPTKPITEVDRVTDNDAETNPNNSVDDPTLPDIEMKSTENQATRNIDLQNELLTENVTQVDTEILEELSEFSNLLNLGEDTVELPLANTSIDPTTDTAMDLEIAMDNAKFIQSHPIVPSNTGTRSSRPRIVSPNTLPPSRGTPHNSVGTNVVSSSVTPACHTSQKGTIQFTSHVLRKPTPEEKKTKKFRCEACEFTGYSCASISIHYAVSHPPCHCNQCGKVYANPNSLARHMYVHNPEKLYECAIKNSLLRVS